MATSCVKSRPKWRAKFSRAVRGPRTARLESRLASCYSSDMHTVEVEQAGPVGELLQRLRAGEELVLTERDVPVARLIRVGAPNGARRFGVAKGHLQVHDDFDAPLEDLDPYTR